MVYEGITVYMQNGKLDDVEIAYYINKLKRVSKGKELKRVTFILGDEYVDLRYLFKNYPFERIFERPSLTSLTALMLPILATPFASVSVTVPFDSTEDSCTG